jgi:transposase, IS5 family
MITKNPKDSKEQDLFRSRLEAMIDMGHALVKLSELVDWEELYQSLKGYYSESMGRPSGSMRLMCGLIFLKQYSGLSDEEVCERWRENPYFQYFCGEEFFQHRLPVKPESLSIFRKRIGETGAEVLLKETVRLGLATGVIKEKDLQHVIVDTTVQEKAIAFPTDLNLCDKARREVVKLAMHHGLPLRQTYKRTAKKVAWETRKKLASGKFKQARAGIKTMKNFLGRVVRDVQRALAERADIEHLFQGALRKAQRIFDQTLTKFAGPKLYAWHAEEVECIGKGKAHKKYEFGCKTAFATTLHHPFVIGAMAFHGNPHDSKTLVRLNDQMGRLTNRQPIEEHVDLGFRGHDVPETGPRVIHPKLKKNITPAIKKRRRRRAAIEPLIGHLKNDGKTGPRNWLKGVIGDKFNAVALAIGFNFRKILKRIFCACLFGLRYSLSKCQYSSPYLQQT